MPFKTNLVSSRLPLESEAKIRPISGIQIGPDGVPFQEVQVTVERPSGVEFFKELMKYILLVSETPDSELRSFAAELGPEAEEAYMTTADMLRDEGKALGRAEALIQVLAVRFGSLSESASQKIDEAPIDQLEEWTARAVTAETLDAVFA